ncbi:transposon Ty3-I Gag-Pol polyprotein [Trichonephila clavipes]|nr:transposon Ty3-I Gag-Pol polyprotein [Trichonephila clavipes]
MEQSTPTSDPTRSVRQKDDEREMTQTEIRKAKPVTSDDEFSKFTWLYPTISTEAAEATNRTKMKSCQNIEIVQLFNDEITAQSQQQRDAFRQDAKKQMYKVQEENRRTYNLRRGRAHNYQFHDLVAIKRTLFGPGMKRKQKYFGPNKVTKVKHNDTYNIEKCDFVDGPSKMSTCEFMKL